MTRTAQETTKHQRTRLERSSDESEASRAAYWNRNIPWSFKNETASYEEKRRLRYSLQDYMHDVIDFGGYKSKLILELGSGGGIDSAEFARNGAEVHSVDFTQTGTQSTHSLIRSAGLQPNSIRSSIVHLPFQAERYDLVYSFGVLHHIPEIGDAVEEIYRVLKPDGEVICMLYNRASLLYAYSIIWMHRDEGLDEQQLVGRYSERALGCPYTRAYTKQDAIELFSKHFDNIAVTVRYNVIDLPDQRKFKLNLSDEFELGWHLIVKGKRKTPVSHQR